MPDWLLELLYQLPADQQFQIYSELDRRSRLNATQFTQEILDLEADLSLQRSLEFKAQAMAHWACSVCPAIAPEIDAYQGRAAQAQYEGMKSVLEDGFSMAHLL